MTGIRPLKKATSASMARTRSGQIAGIGGLGNSEIQEVHAERKLNELRLMFRCNRATIPPDLQRLPRIVPLLQHELETGEVAEYVITDIGSRSRSGPAAGQPDRGVGRSASKPAYWIASAGSSLPPQPLFSAGYGVLRAPVSISRTRRNVLAGSCCSGASACLSSRLFETLMPLPSGRRRRADRPAGPLSPYPTSSSVSRPSLDLTVRLSGESMKVGQLTEVRLGRVELDDVSRFRMVSPGPQRLPIERAEHSACGDVVGRVSTKCSKTLIA